MLMHTHIEDVLNAICMIKGVNTTFLIDQSDSGVDLIEDHGRVVTMEVAVNRIIHSIENTMQEALDRS